MSYFRLAVWRMDRAIAICFESRFFLSQSCGYMNRRSWMAVPFVERCLKKAIEEQMLDGSGEERSWR